MHSTEQRKARGFYGYVIVALVFCIMLVAWGIFLSFGVFFEPVLKEFGWTRAATSGAYSLSFLVIGPLSIGVGRLIDRFGPRLVMTGCGFFLGLGFLLMSQISAIWQFYLFYGVIIGIGMSATFVPANSIVPRWFVRRTGLMTGIVLAGAGVGIVTIPPAARWLIATYGWRTSYIIVSIVALIVIILAAQFLKRDPAQVGQLPYGAEKLKVEGLSLKARGFSLGEAIQTKQFWLLCVISFCIWYSVGTIMVHIVIHSTGLGIALTTATSILVLIGGMSIIGKAIMGGVADKIGNKSALMISFAIMSASFLWLIVAREMWTFYLFGVIFGFAYGALSPLVSPAVAELFGVVSHGVIFGITFCVGNLGEALGPVVAGGIFDVMRSYQLAFLLCAGVCAIGIILSSLLRPTKTSAT